MWHDEPQHVIAQAQEKAFVHFWVWPGPVNRGEERDFSPQAFRQIEKHGAYFESVLPLCLNAIAGNSPELEIRQYCYDRVRQYEIGDPLSGKTLMDLVQDHAAKNGVDRQDILQAIAEPLVQPKVACEAIGNIARTRPWIEGLSALAGLEWAILQVARFEKELPQFRSTFDSKTRDRLARSSVDNRIGRLLNGGEPNFVDAAWALVRKHIPTYAPLGSQQRNIILAARDGAWAYRYYWDRIIIAASLGITPSPLSAD